MPSLTCRDRHAKVGAECRTPQTAHLRLSKYQPLQASSLAQPPQQGLRERLSDLRVAVGICRSQFCLVWPLAARVRFKPGFPKFSRSLAFSGTEPPTRQSLFLHFSSPATSEIRSSPEKMRKTPLANQRIAKTPSNRLKSSLPALQGVNWALSYPRHFSFETRD